jgi:hypothetical protein
MKIIKNCINVSKKNNFIFPSPKFPDLEKWDVSCNTTIISWNYIRR